MGDPPQNPGSLATSPRFGPIKSREIERVEQGTSKEEQGLEIRGQRARCRGCRDRRLRLCISAVREFLQTHSEIRRAGYGPAPRAILLRGLRKGRHNCEKRGRQNGALQNGFHVYSRRPLAARMFEANIFTCGTCSAAQHRPRWIVPRICTIIRVARWDSRC